MGPSSDRDQTGNQASDQTNDQTNKESGGEPHPTTFVQSTGEIQIDQSNRNQAGEFYVSSGFENLQRVIMKIAGLRLRRLHSSIR